MQNSKLNELLVETFNIILKSEEESLRAVGDSDLSINEIHLLEIAEKMAPGQNAISALAASMFITMPSVTVAVKKLEHKGYVKKLKSPDDGRRVLITLTEKGKEVSRRHKDFHDTMVAKITEQFNDADKEILFGMIDKLNKFFKKAIS